MGIKIITVYLKSNGSKFQILKHIWRHEILIQPQIDTEERRCEVINCNSRNKADGNVRCLTVLPLGRVKNNV
jgi:hypothetical protein